MAKLGLNCWPIDIYSDVSQPVTVPQPILTRAHASARRTISDRIGGKAWRGEPWDADGLPDTSGAYSLSNFRKTKIGELCEYAIEHDDVLYLNCGDLHFSNTATSRAGVGADSIWKQTNWAYWSYHFVPVEARARRTEWRHVVLDYYLWYLRSRNVDPARYLRLCAASEIKPMVLPTVWETTLTGGPYSVGATSVTVADASGLVAEDWVTIASAGAWQSFQILSKVSNTLNVKPDTAGHNLFNRSNGLTVAANAGQAVYRCHKPLGITSNYSSYQWDELEEIIDDLVTYAPGVPIVGPCFNLIERQLFMLNEPGRNFGDIDILAWTSYPETFDLEGFPTPRKAMSIPQWRRRLEQYWLKQWHDARRVNKYGSATKPQTSVEFGVNAQALYMNTAGNYPYDHAIMGAALTSALDLARDMPFDHMILWGVGRSETNDFTSLGLASTPPDNDDEPSMYERLRVGLEYSSVPAGFVNAGASSGQTSAS